MQTHIDNKYAPINNFSGDRSKMSIAKMENMLACCKNTDRTGLEKHGLVKCGLINNRTTS